MCACPSNFITDAQASTAPCTPVQLWATPGGQTATCRPLPPPPPSLRSGHSGGVPSGPPVYAGSSTATQAPSPGRLQGRAALGAPWSPSPCRPSTPWAEGPVHDNTTSALGSQEVWTPPVVRPGSAPPCLMQSWGRWQHVNDREAAYPDRTLPRRAQRQAPIASLPGPGAPGITQPPTRRRKRAGPGAAQPCDPSCPTSATSMHAPPTCPVRATHTGTAASPSRVCHHGVRGRSTVRQALGPDNRDSPSPVVSAQRRVLTVGQGVRHRP